MTPLVEHDLPKKVDGKLIAAQKKEKFRKKQEKKLLDDKKAKDQTGWLQKHSKFTIEIDEGDAKIIIDMASSRKVANIEQHSKKRQRIEVKPESKREELLNERLAYIQPFINLKDSNGDPLSVQEVNEGKISIDGRRYFIAEGTETVRMLLEQSTSKDRSNNGLVPITIHSILTKPSPFFEDPVNLRGTIANVYAEYFEEKEDATNTNSLPFQIIVASEEAMSKVVGFNVARGAMACGIVPHYDEIWLKSFLKKKYDDGKSNIRVLALENVCDTANLGSLIRTSAAFGINAIILSDDSCDVFYRRCVRVSMGHALTVPSIRVSDLSSTLKSLRESFQVVSYAAVIDKDADMVLEETKRGQISRNWCCVLGNEGNGLTKGVALSCDHRLRIDMSEEVDSLSVGIAAGILMHGMREREQKIK
jgi:tRNA G18 (ribose-2'-O)-methylase SpoU